MLNPFTAVAIFLIQTIFNLLVWLLLLRFLLQMVKANFYNPLSQVIVKLTSFSNPIRRVTRGTRRFDLASLLIASFFITVKWSLLALLQGYPLPHLSTIIMVLVVELSKQIMNILFYAMLISVFLTWVNPQGTQLLAQITNQLTEPLIKFVRQRIPLVAGIDISPLIILILLQMMSILVTQFSMNMV